MTASHRSCSGGWDHQSGNSISGQHKQLTARRHAYDSTQPCLPKIKITTAESKQEFNSFEKLLCVTYYTTGVLLIKRSCPEQSPHIQIIQLEKTSLAVWD